MSIERKDDSSVLISISAGISSIHLVLVSKPPILTLQKLILSLFKSALKDLGIARFIFKSSVSLSKGLRKNKLCFSIFFYFPFETISISCNQYFDPIEILNRLEQSDGN